MSLYLFITLAGVSSAWAALEMTKHNGKLKDFSTLYPSRLPVPDIMLEDATIWHDHYCAGTGPSGCIPNLPVRELTINEMQRMFTPEQIAFTDSFVKHVMMGNTAYKHFDVWKEVDMSCCLQGTPDDKEYICGEVAGMWVTTKSPRSKYRQGDGPHQLHTIVSKHHCIAPPICPVGSPVGHMSRGKYCTPDHYRLFLDHNPKHLQIASNEVLIFDPHQLSYRPVVTYNIMTALKAAFYVMPIWTYSRSQIEYVYRKHMDRRDDTVVCAQNNNTRIDTARLDAQSREIEQLKSLYEVLVKGISSEQSKVTEIEDRLSELETKGVTNQPVASSGLVDVNEFRDVLTKLHEQIQILDNDLNHVMPNPEMMIAIKNDLVSDLEFHKHFQGEQGEEGDIGPPGPVGPQGPQGPPGRDGVLQANEHGDDQRQIGLPHQINFEDLLPMIRNATIQSREALGEAILPVDKILDVMNTRRPELTAGRISNMLMRMDQQDRERLGTSLENVGHRIAIDANTEKIARFGEWKSVVLPDGTRVQTPAMLQTMWDEWTKQANWLTDAIFEDKKDEKSSLRARLKTLQERVVALLPLEQQVSAIKIENSAFAKASDLGKIKSQLIALSSEIKLMMKKDQFITTHEEVTRWAEINVPEKIAKHEQLLQERNFFPIDVTANRIGFSRVNLQSLLSFYGCLPGGSILSYDSKIKWLEYRSPEAGGTYTRSQTIVRQLDQFITQFQALKLNIIELPDHYLMVVHNSQTKVTAYELFTTYKEYYLL